MVYKERYLIQYTTKKLHVILSYLISPCWHDFFNSVTPSIYLVDVIPSLLGGQARKWGISLDSSPSSIHTTIHPFVHPLVKSRFHKLHSILVSYSSLLFSVSTSAALVQAFNSVFLPPFLHVDGDLCNFQAEQSSIIFYRQGHHTLKSWARYTWHSWFVSQAKYKFGPQTILAILLTLSGTCHGVSLDSAHSVPVSRTFSSLIGLTNSHFVH